ncbi:hypothetical protein K1X84_00140 [bacterium]|nr:hypothetical protein [bacterium]
MKTSPFELWLFYHNLPFALAALQAGVTGLIVDWENQNKKSRQNGFDTQINHHTYDDLVKLRKESNHPIICRINGVDSNTPDEIEKALDAGANEILVPMVRSQREIDLVITYVRERCGVGIMIETCDAITILKDLAELPLSRAYVGLNDLRIDRIRLGLPSANLFSPFADGTVDHVRRFFKGTFGLAGLTLPEKGTPIPCRLLMSEMARLRCKFSFLRRSFIADVQQDLLPGCVKHIRQSLQELFHSDQSVLEANRIQFQTLIQEIPHGQARPESLAHVSAAR